MGMQAMKEVLRTTFQAAFETIVSLWAVIVGLMALAVVLVGVGLVVALVVAPTTVLFR